MFVITNSKTLQNVFSSKIMVFLGKISFSLYLVHFLLINSLGSYIFIKIIYYFNYHISFLISFVITFSFSVVVACIFYNIIDAPSISLSNKFSEFILDKVNFKKDGFLYQIFNLQSLKLNN